MERISYLMPPLLWGMLDILMGPLGCWAGARSPGSCPAGLVCPLNCPFAGLFNPIIGAGFAVLAVAMGSTSQLCYIYICVFFLQLFLLMHLCVKKTTLKAEKIQLFLYLSFLKNVLCPQSDVQTSWKEEVWVWILSIYKTTLQKGRK